MGVEAKNRNGYRRVAGRLSTADQCIESRFPVFSIRLVSIFLLPTIAGKWLQTLSLEYLAENDFLKLSYGQQRMILIARAMVKSPSLLILDEPCQGLDPNRNQILKDPIGSGTPTQILYVTHSPEDLLHCLDYELRF